MILVADALHNFIGGLGVAGAFVIDVRVGIGAWLAAAAHEVPQEMGNFIYIAAANLFPEVKHDDSLTRAGIHFLSFLAGLLRMLAARAWFDGG